MHFSAQVNSNTTEFKMTGDFCVFKIPPASVMWTKIPLPKTWLKTERTKSLVTVFSHYEQSQRTNCPIYKINLLDRVRSVLVCTFFFTFSSCLKSGFVSILFCSNWQAFNWQLQNLTYGVRRGSWKMQQRRIFSYKEIVCTILILVVNILPSHRGCHQSR